MTFGPFRLPRLVKVAKTGQVDSLPDTPKTDVSMFLTFLRRAGAGPILRVVTN